MYPIAGHNAPYFAIGDGLALKNQITLKRLAYDKYNAYQYNMQSKISSVGDFEVHLCFLAKEWHDRLPNTSDEGLFLWIE